MRIITTFLLMTFSFCLIAQSPLGVWKTIDDETGEAKSHVEIYENDGKLFGKIVKLLINPEDTKCDCSGERKDKPVLGMVIIEDVVPYKDYWSKGTIFSPTKDATYRCSFWFEDNNADELYLRGKHWTGIYRTQKWYRVN